MMIDIDLLLVLGAAYKKIPKGDTVFSEGSSCWFYYQLVSGRVRWLNIDDDGKEFIQTIIEPGEGFGELPLFDDEMYAASAIADEESVVIFLHRVTFAHLIRENPDLHFKFSRLLAQRVRFKLTLLKSIASHDPECRINALLGYLKKKEKSSFCFEDWGRLNLTRQQLADMTGLRVETVIRSMRHMHEKSELLIEKGIVFY